MPREGLKSLQQTATQDDAGAQARGAFDARQVQSLREWSQGKCVLPQVPSLDALPGTPIAIGRGLVAHALSRRRPMAGSFTPSHTHARAQTSWRGWEGRRGDGVESRGRLGKRGDCTVRERRQGAGRSRYES